MAKTERRKFWIIEVLLYFTVWVIEVLLYFTFWAESCIRERRWVRWESYDERSA